MSRFTKRRKAARQEKEEKQRRWEENSKKFEKTCNDILKAAEMVGDLDQYCAAVITGKELNIEELIDESKNQ